VGGLASALYRHATDGPSESRIDLDVRADAAAVPVRAMADAAIRGRESDLLVWLTNRGTGSWIETSGQRRIAAGRARVRR
jgi:hypothetical protein